jgi:hypothetical protein
LFVKTGAPTFTNTRQELEIQLYRHGAEGARDRIPNSELTFASSDSEVAKVVDGVVRPGPVSGVAAITIHHEGRPYVMDVHVELNAPAPILNYDFDSVDGAIIPDASGNGFHGAYVNAAQTGARVVEGVRGKAINLSGGERGSTTAPYITIPNGVLNGVGGFTVAAWVRWTDSATSYANLFWLGGAGTGGGSNRYLWVTPRGPAASYAAGLKPTYSAGEVRAQANPAIDNRQHRLSAGFSARNVPPESIYLLERGTHARVSRLAGGEALAALIRFSYLTRFGRSALAVGDAGLHLKQCAALLGQCTVCRLEVPAGLDRLGEMVALIDLAPGGARE